MGECFFTGRLNDMALGQAINFFCRLMGYLFDVRVAPFAFYFGMHAIVKYGLVYKQEPEFTFFIHPAQAWVLVAHQAVADIGGVGMARHKKGERQKQHTRRKDESFKRFENHILQASNIIDRLASSHNWEVFRDGLHGIRLNPA